MISNILHPNPARFVHLFQFFPLNFIISTWFLWIYSFCGSPVAQFSPRLSSCFHLLWASPSFIWRTQLYPEANEHEKDEEATNVWFLWPKYNKEQRLMRLHASWIKTGIKAWTLDMSVSVQPLLLQVFRAKCVCHS